ncbi:MAG TPA: glycosyltransferase family 2 protein [Mycobacteriales bacterium]|nr:glycosyltransferase family 2 protein [Mycobacteriales bacterium]
MPTTDAERPRLNAVGYLDRAVARLRQGAGARVIAVIPAHNEADGIAFALDSMDRQSRRPDLVVVVADNCTDDTEQIVRKRGGTVVVTTVANTCKKAGALNLVLDRLLPRLQPADGVLVVDADSSLDDGFVEAALGRLGRPAADGSGKTIGGVGGTFRGGRGGGFVGMLQRNEYARYARDVRRLKGKVLVLTGTAALFSVEALRRVVQARALEVIPGGAAQVYDTHVLTEDNELTLALLHLNYAVLSPRECLLETEIMTTWRDLWNQRVRWKRGALENLVDYGMTAVTWRYWGRQALTHLGVFVTTVYLATIVLSLAVNGGVHLHPIWIAATGVFVAERVITVRDRGPLQMALASLIFVEMSFDIFLQAAQASAFWHTLRHSERNW